VIFGALFCLTARRGVTDPVCGMKVDRAKAVTTEHDGQTHAFCSAHCRDAFLADPGRYTDSTRHHRQEHHHSGEPQEAGS
jgi:YHS domain-containing protein